MRTSLLTVPDVLEQDQGRSGSQHESGEDCTDWDFSHVCGLIIIQCPSQHYSIHGPIQRLIYQEVGGVDKRLFHTSGHLRVYPDAYTPDQESTMTPL